MHLQRKILTPSILNLRKSSSGKARRQSKSHYLAHSFRLPMPPRTMYWSCSCWARRRVLVNVYDHEVRSWQVPDNADIPIIASEFHGAPTEAYQAPALLLYGINVRGASRMRYLAHSQTPNSLACTGFSGLINLLVEGETAKTIRLGWQTLQGDHMFRLLISSAMSQTKKKRFVTSTPLLLFMHWTNFLKALL